MSYWIGSTATWAVMAEPDRIILADHVQLAIVARKANNRCRWAAMSSGRWTTRACSARGASRHDTVLNLAPMLCPMHRGNVARAIERQRLLQGLPSIRKTFGAGYKALLAEDYILPAVRP